MRDRLPPAPVPLKPEYGIVEANLQDCFNWAYDQGPYAGDVDYDQPAVPPLAVADAEWAKQLVHRVER